MPRLMPLHVRFDINDNVIGELTITHKETDGDRAHYYYQYRGARGSASGWVWHRPPEGAMVLAAKVIEQIDFPNWRFA